MQRIDPMTISLRRPLPTAELQRLDMKNNAFYWATRASQSYSFADLILKFNIANLRERKHPNVFYARKAHWENIWKYFTLGATKSASIVRVVSPKECNLFESSMLSSSSIFVSSLMLQRSCNLAQTLFIRWLRTCTKPRCHNLTKFPQKQCIGGYINFNKFCLPLVVSGILHICLETK